VALIAVAGGFVSPATASPEGVAVLKKYDVVINGMTTTLLLSDEDAVARGLTHQPKADAPATKAHVPANKARKPATKRAEAAADAFTKKADPA
jgi:hypothetical protein